jgi:hypothetical protein
VNWRVVARALTWVAYDILARRSKVTEENQETLGEVVEWLTEHPDQMFILRDRTAAMVYSPKTECVHVVDGDFNGDHEWCNFMLHKRLWEMELMD